MRFTRKHGMILVVCLALFIAFSFTIDALSQHQINRNREYELSMEADLLREIQVLRYEQRYTGENSYYYFGNYAGYATDRNIYFANTENYRQLLESHGIKNVDKIRVDKDYCSRLPLDHKNLLGSFKRDPKRYPPNLVVVADKGHVLYYSHIDSRLADFTKIYGMTSATGGHFRLKLAPSGRLIFEEDVGTMEFKEESEKTTVEVTPKKVEATTEEE